KSTANIVRNEIKYIADLELQLNEIPMVICNSQQINQVIANLLVNAGQAMDRHGTITVTSRQEGEQVVLSISDTGRGMTEEIRKRIFEPFFTTKDIGKGTGLGLSIAYDIIKKHGGDITLESEPGEGTTFTIRLPIKKT
ncbi:MAG: sensor histidine kinase, partial [Syntrophales bacterium]